jgi:hypothetical protein
LDAAGHRHYVALDYLRVGDAIALNVSPMPGNTLVIGHAPRARTISAAFLNSYNDHFNRTRMTIDVQNLLGLLSAS